MTTSAIPVIGFDMIELDMIESQIPFKVFRIEEHPKLSEPSHTPRRDTFYVVFWVTAGEGRYVIDFEHYEIRANTFFFIAPGQVHYWIASEPVQGFAFPFEAEFFHLNARPSFLGELDLFDLVDRSAALYLDKQEAEKVNRFIQNLYEEYYSNATDFGHLDAILCLFQLLLIRAQRSFTITTKYQPRNAGELLTRSFLQLMKQQATTEHNLQAYAAQLGVTAGHLGETVKSVTGLPAGKLIRRRLVLEAKRLLVHTDLTMAQITEELNFNDPSYFGRFFKRESGQSPRAFRQSFRQKHENLHQ